MSEQSIHHHPPSGPLYTTPLDSHPYSPTSTLNTLTLHLPTTPPLTPSYPLLYIHGGAFRDPLITSASILPSLPSLFSPTSTNAGPNTHPSKPGHHISAVISLNYRLAAYPTHPTHPSKPGDESRNARWPEHLHDIRDAIVYLHSDAFTNALYDCGLDGAAAERVGLKGRREWILAGHSVGATMALMLALTPWPDDGRWGLGWGVGSDAGRAPGGDEDGDAVMGGLVGVICLEGIYDFVALRDRHLDAREFYEPWIREAFGEEEVEWEKGDVLGYVRAGKGGVRRGVKKVILGHSKGDEAVEWEQSEHMSECLGRGREGMYDLVECEGAHDEVISEGKEVAKCVAVVVQALVEDR